MKKILYCVAALLAFIPLAPASPTPAPRKPPPKKVDESDLAPVIGMTKFQVLSRYGKPNRKTTTEDGEQWTYILNMGQFIGKHMIPFFVSTQALRIGVLTFGSDGRLKKFRWDVPED